MVIKIPTLNEAFALLKCMENFPWITKKSVIKLIRPNEKKENRQLQVYWKFVENSRAFLGCW